MRLVLGLTALLSSLTVSLQKQPCKSPPYLTGDFLTSLDEGKYWNYEYNTELQRMRVSETEHHTNRTVTFDYLLHFREGIMFEIDDQTLTCTKRALRTDYQPIGIPHDAIYVENVIRGTLSVPNAGMSMTRWTGHTTRGEEYTKVVTEEGCVPCSTLYQSEKYGEVVFVFMNNILHLTPDDLSPPSICNNISVKFPDIPVDFLSLFSKNKARRLTRRLSELKKVYLNNYTTL